MSNVIELTKATLSDIPRILRSIADQMEAGDYGNVVAGIVVLEESPGKLHLFGGGAADDHRAVSLIAGAQQIMIQRTYGRSTEV